MNRQVLEELANSLVDAETLAGPALEVFLEAVQALAQAARARPQRRLARHPPSAGRWRRG